MLKTVLPYRNNWTDWLIPLSLWWSVFCFSGFVPAEFLSLSSPDQIELVETKVFSKPFISFQNTATNFFINKDSNYSSLRFYAVLFAYNQLVRTKYYAYIKQGYKYNFFTINFPLKFLPQLIKDYPSPTF